LSNKEKKKTAGFLKVESVKETYSFGQLLTHGLDFSIIICYDFSRKKHWKIHKKFKHDLMPLQANIYQSMTQSFLEILQYYDRDKLVPLFGLAGVPEGNSSPSDFFPLVKGVIGSTIKEQHEIYEKGVKKIRDGMGLKLMKSLVEIRNMNEAEFNNDPMNYTIALYFVRNEIEDLEFLECALKDFSKSALSILIIGLGDSPNRFKEVQKRIDRFNKNDDFEGKRSCHFFYYDSSIYEVKTFRRMVLGHLPIQINKFYQEMKIELKEKRKLNYDDFLKLSLRKGVRY